MVLAVTSLILFLAAISSKSLARLPRPSGNVETLAAAGEALQDVLATVWQPQCSVVLLLDGSTSAATVFTEIGQLAAPWGVAVLEVAEDGQEANVRQEQLSRAVGQARRLRQVSWCVRVVVVSDDPAFLAAFAHWSLKGRLLVWSTRLLALTRLPLHQLVHLNTTFSMTNSMLIIVEDAPGSFRCNVYVHLPYSPQAAHVLRVASWMPRRGLHLTTRFSLFPEKFNKLFYGPTLVVAAEESEPQIALEKPKNAISSILSFTGPMVNLLGIISNAMNFTYRYLRPPDGSWGVKLEDGSWTGMVGMVGRKEVDIGLGPFDVTATRAEVVDFTSAILTETVRIHGARGRPEVDPWGFLLPLAPLVWAAILTTLLLLPATVLLLSTGSGLKTISNTSSSDMFFGYLRVVVQQDILVPPALWWERLVLASWMMMTLVLTRSYAGNLMSNLAVRYIPQPYQSLREVMDDSSVTMVWEVDTSYVQYFRAMKSGIFREIADSEKQGRIKYVRGSEFYNTMNSFVRQGDHVIIAQDKYGAVLKSQDFARTGRCDFYSSQERFMPFMSGMIGQKDSPLVPVMSESIKSVTQAGLYEHWIDAYMPNSTSCAYPPTKIAVNTSLSVHNLWGMFVVLIGGYTVSLLVLGLEVLGDVLF